MIAQAWISITVCLAALLAVTLIVRSERRSLGLPVAYMAALLLIHVPGAFAYAFSSGDITGVLAGRDYPAKGIELTAVGASSFVIGVLFVHLLKKKSKKIPKKMFQNLSGQFGIFCLMCGWFSIFVLTPFRNIPTVGAAIYFGAAVWMLGIMIGLERAISLRNWHKIFLWTGALLVYPLYMLLFAGFLSYGSTAVIIVLSFLVARFWRNTEIFVTAGFVGYLGITLFVNYYIARDDLRDVIWSGAGTEDRLGVTIRTFSNFKFFDVNDPRQMSALAARLNQNELAGLAEERLQTGVVDYLAGRSFYDGLISLVPRALWPDKPVYGGSPAIVSKMTGLQLNEETSWGVGNVMEFYINFGISSLIICFLALGATIALLDLKAFENLVTFMPSSAILYFLPGVALIQPNGSMVEMIGGAGAALAAAVGWRFLWKHYNALTLRQSRETSRNRGPVGP